MTDQNEQKPRAVKGTQSIGKGSLAIMFAQLAFLGFNFLLRTFLAHRISAADLDIYHLVVSVLIMSFQRIIHYGLPVAVSKYLSQDPAYLGYFMTKGLRLQIYFSLILFLIAILLTPAIVGAVNNKTVVIPYLLGCLSIPFFAIYNIRLCILNGLRRFYQEALTMFSYGLFRLVTIIIFFYVIAFVYPGLNLLSEPISKWGLDSHALNWAVMANTLSAVLGLTIAWLLTRESFGYKEDPDMFRDIVQFVGPNILSILLLHLLMNVDVFIINRFFASDLTPAGYYSQAAFVALLPFILFNALYATIFPNIVYEISSGAIEKAKEIVLFSTRVVSIVLIPICFIVWGCSGEIIDFLNPPDYISSSLAMSILIVSISFFTLFMNLGVITVAGGHPRKFTSSFLLLLPIGVILNYFLVPFCAKNGLNWIYGNVHTMDLISNGSSRHIDVVWSLGGAAIAAGLTAIIGCIYLGIHVRKRFGGLIELKTTFRAVVASIPAYLVVRYFPSDGYMLLVSLTLSVIVYAIAIILAGEVNREELAQILKKFKKN
jgi:O-antigen/teichoic acid export membrane protein